jgi:hypothetical protein
MDGMDEHNAMMTGISNAVNKYKFAVARGDVLVGSIQVMEELNVLRSRYPEQARADLIQKAQRNFMSCLQQPSSRAQTCHSDFVGDLEYLLL